MCEMVSIMLPAVSRSSATRGKSQAEATLIFIGAFNRFISLGFHRRASYNNISHTREYRAVVMDTPSCWRQHSFGALAHSLFVLNVFLYFISQPCVRITAPCKHAWSLTCVQFKNGSSCRFGRETQTEHRKRGSKQNHTSTKNKDVWNSPTGCPGWLIK